MANQVPYGFYDLLSVMDRRTTEVATPLINTAIDRSLAAHNQEVRALLDLFTVRTTDSTLRYTAGGIQRLQPLDQFGRALPTQGGTSYDTAYPLQSGGAAFGQTFKARAKMTVQEVAAATAAIMEADARWLRDHILATLYQDSDWTFRDEQKGTLTIKPLANGDTQTYSIMTGADSGATDDHILAQAAAIADATNPYPAIYTDLAEHPENAGPFIALIPTSLKATTVALATFFERAPAELSPGTAQTLTATLGVDVPGTTLGWESGGLWIVEWPNLPADYIVAVAAGGDKALAMREEPEPELQGFRRVAERDDHPYYESQYQRHAGFGVRNRVGALIYRIGNGTYAVPTNYTAPMP